MKAPDLDTAPAENARDVLSARAAALEIFSEILDRRQTLDSALDSALDNSEALKTLDTRDRAFIRMLVATTLRRLGQIDLLIEKAQERPDSLKLPLVRHILRLGAAQLFFMEVPGHAAVDTAVQLAGHAGLERQKGFINALLRTLAKNGPRWLEGQDAARLNTPDWLLKLWIADYGLNMAARIAAAHMHEAPLDITVKDSAQRGYWSRIFKASELNTGTIRCVSSGKISAYEGFNEGEWWVQDAAAAIPALLFGKISGQDVVDLCAAPGGKTMQLVSMGAQVTALDRSARRLQRLEENLERIGLRERVRAEVADAEVWAPLVPPQRILLDAPCSATGTIRRHPDTPYLKTPRDIERLAALQSRLLDHAAKILAPGGTLVYCTCSLQKDEGERQIERFLKRKPFMQRVPVRAEEIGNYKELIDENGDLRILPCHLSSQGGMDGFFISRMVKHPQMSSRA